MSACGNWQTSGRLTSGKQVVRIGAATTISACEGHDGQQMHGQQLQEAFGREMGFVNQAVNAY
jgi:hypothetical protein